jgi:hypothetical protein
MGSLPRVRPTNPPSDWLALPIYCAGVAGFDPLPPVTDSRTSRWWTWLKSGISWAVGLRAAHKQEAPAAAPLSPVISIGVRALCLLPYLSWPLFVFSPVCLLPDLCSPLFTFSPVCLFPYLSSPYSNVSANASRERDLDARAFCAVALRRS